MSFRDRVAKDITRTFMNPDHFGETHYWNGYEIICVPDEEEALKRKNNNVNDISWDNNVREMLVHTPLASFPGGKAPEPNTHVIFDNRQYKVLSVDHAIGMLHIMLSAQEPMELI